jgi:hypothetical protein
MCIPHTQDIGYSATATSVVCLFGFPIQRFKDLISKNPDFESAMSIEMLPVVVLLTKEIDINHIPAFVWNRIKSNVVYNRVPKGHKHTEENCYIILTEGTMTISERTTGRGYYKLMGTRGVITGPAKYMVSQHPFEDIRENEKRYSSVLSRGVKAEGPTMFDLALRE